MSPFRHQQSMSTRKKRPALYALYPFPVADPHCPTFHNVLSISPAYSASAPAKWKYRPCPLGLPPPSPTTSSPKRVHCVPQAFTNRLCTTQRTIVDDHDSSTRPWIRPSCFNAVFVCELLSSCFAVADLVYLYRLLKSKPNPSSSTSPSFHTHGQRGDKAGGPFWNAGESMRGGNDEPVANSKPNAGRNSESSSSRRSSVSLSNNKPHSKAPLPHTTWPGSASPTPTTRTDGLIASSRIRSISHEGPTQAKGPHYHHHRRRNPSPPMVSSLIPHRLPPPVSPAPPALPWSLSSWSVNDDGCSDRHRTTTIQRRKGEEGRRLSGAVRGLRLRPLRG